MRAAEFIANVAEEARSFATRHCDDFDTIALDLRAPGSGDEAGIYAMLSLWTPGRDGLEDLVWQGIGSSVSVVRLDAAQTPSEALFRESEEE